MKTMAWDSEAWRAFVRAFAPMPPFIKRRAMKKMAERVEHSARGREADSAGLSDVYIGCVEVLSNKDPFMLESLLAALRDEGYEFGQEGE